MGLTLVYSLIYIFLLGIFAEYLVWATIAVVQITLLVSSAICITKSFEGGDSLMFLCGAVIFSTLSMIFGMLVYSYFKQLRLALDIFKVSADFIRQSKRVLVVPIFYYFVTIGIIGLWLFGVMGLSTTGEIKAETETI
jgi:hypothetical protein